MQILLSRVEFQPTVWLFHPTGLADWTMDAPFTSLLGLEDIGYPEYPIS